MSPHAQWVAGGNCPAVRWSKAWCNDRAGHDGPHWSTLVRHPGDEGVRDYWGPSEVRDTPTD